MRRLMMVGLVALGLALVANGCAVDTSSEESVGVSSQPLCGTPPGGGDPDWCSGGCTCGRDEGDCDTDAECDAALYCAKNVGTTYGWPADYDVCQPVGTCKRFHQPDSLTHCSAACKCGEGEGGCTTDNDCDTGLSCLIDRGPAVGLPTTYDLCMAACPPFDASKPNASFCTAQCPCGLDEGDCDRNSECVEGQCVADIGGTVGLPNDWDLCACPAFNAGSPKAGFCAVNGCPCAAGEGNCASDAECQTGLVCNANRGAAYGLPATYGVCEPPGTCPTFSVSQPSLTFCTVDCPCGEAEGGCSSTSQCEPGLTCLQDRGPYVGLSTTYDLCMAACPPYDVTKLNENFCSTQCPCAEGEGDCDTDTTCVQSVCGVDNAGGGLPAGWDVCTCTFTTANPNLNFCTKCGPCAAGTGDCDADTECDAGLICIRQGVSYGLPSTYDVCVAGGLTNVAFSAGSFPFDPQVTSYTGNVGFIVSSLTVTPTFTAGTVTVNGVSVATGVGRTISLSAGANIITVVHRIATGISRTYTYTVTRSSTFTQQEYIKASNTEASDRFAERIALDGNVLAISAQREDSNATGINGNQSDNSAPNAGAVYIFRRSGNVWTQEAYIKASNNEGSDQFGYALDLSGDTLVVGAYGEASAATGINGNEADNTATGAGAAYIFVRSSGGVWTQQAYLKASNTSAADNFGWSVSISGDTVAVGARFEDTSNPGINPVSNGLNANSGAVYVFTRSAGVWSQQAFIKASNPGLNDDFGIDVDVDGDRLAVGAFFEDSAATGVGGDQADDMAADSGAAYVFLRTAGVWAQQAYIKASNTGADDRFGGSVTIDGNRLAVSAGQEDGDGTSEGDNSATDSGAVYLFTETGGVWSQEAYLKASNAEAGDSFGAGISLSGTELLICAPNEDSAATGVGGNQMDNSATDSGAGYLFQLSGGVWSQTAYVKASNTDPGDKFGVASAVWQGTYVIAGGFEASNAIGVGGNQSDNSMMGAGAAYVFE